MFTHFPQFEERFAFVMSGSNLDCYNKSQQVALFLNFFFGKELYMFRTDLLSIIRSLNTVFTAVGICHVETLKMSKFTSIYTYRLSL